MAEVGGRGGVRSPRFWQSRRHRRAAAARRITTCPPRFSNLAPSLNLYLSLPGGKLTLEYYCKHNHKNCFKEVDSVGFQEFVWICVIFIFQLFYFALFDYWLLCRFLNSQIVTLVILILVKKRNNVLGACFFQTRIYSFFR